MAVTNYDVAPAEEQLTGMELSFEGLDMELPDFTVEEVMLGESLLTQSPQTALTIHNYQHNVPIKNLDKFKNATLKLDISRPILKEFGFPTEMTVKQQVYRIDNRNPINRSTEEFTMRAIDVTTLNDAESLVSKSWKCSTPTEVVEYVLKSCAGAERMVLEDSGIARGYMAENIHPFQVINQQSNVALTAKGDPSFLHFMTYENGGTHHFRSLEKMCQQDPVIKFYQVEATKGYTDPRGIMTCSFPCDFDLLSDILNGYDRYGKDISSMMVFNPANKMFSLVGNQIQGCGIGSGVFKMGSTNINTERNQNTCPTGIEKYGLKRQARMALIERDKIALRLTVPFNPILNVGKVIELLLFNRDTPESGLLNYGSGKYLVLHLTHNIKRGGFATTTMDCVASTVGNEGKV